MSNFEDNLFSILLKKPFLTCILGDFNVSSSRWYKNDNSSPGSLQIESLATYYGLTQVINEVTHLLPNSLF